MRCRTGIAQSSALPRSKPVAVPDQRRTASRFLRPQIVEGLVYALALRRIRSTGLRYASAYEVGVSLGSQAARENRKHLRPTIDAQV